MRLITICCFLFLPLLAIPWDVCGSDDILFRNSFDHYSIHAEQSSGSPRGLGLGNGDLQLRMFPGVNNQGNALVLAENECCEYKMAGNFDPNGGTVSLWVAAQDWKPSDKQFHVFFEAIDKDFRLIIYKFHYANTFFFYLKSPAISGQDNVATAAVWIDDVTFGLNEWHKFDAVWDSSGMRLYVDGVLPAQKEWRNPEVKFPEPTKFASKRTNSTGKLFLGMSSDWKANGSCHTAFDNLMIYDRPLSVLEIAAEYEKVRPSSFGTNRKRNLLPIPQSSVTPTIDGMASTDEWKDASHFPIGERLPFTNNGGESFSPAWGKVKHVDGKLFVLLHVDRPPHSASIRERDGNVWIDDSFELHFTNGKSSCQFIINANNAVYDKRDENISWNSSIESAVKRTGTAWTVELGIPLSELPEADEKSTLQGNFYGAFHSNTGTTYQGWSTSGRGVRFDTHDAFGTLLLRPDALAFQVFESIGVNNIGVSIQTNSGRVVKRQLVTWSFPNGTRERSEAEFLNKEYARQLPAGRHALELLCLDNAGNEIFRYEKYLTINPPLSLTLRNLPSQKIIQCHVDLSTAGAAVLKQANTKGLDCRLAVANNGQVRAEHSVRLSSIVSDIELPLPRETNPGMLTVTANVLDMSAKAELRVPDANPYLLKIADDHSIPPPFTSIERLSEKTFALLDRVYSFGDSPAPVFVTSRKQSVLTRAPEWLVDTGNGPEKVKWSQFKVVSVASDEVRLSGRGRVGTLQFSWYGNLYFDGVYKLVLEMKPTRQTSVIKKFIMQYAVPANHAEFCLTPLLRPWENGKINLRFAVTEPNGMHDFLVWLTGHERGFAWWPESDANFVNGTAEKQISIMNSGDSVDVTVGIITKEVALSQKASYTMAFMATPAKSRIDGWRNINLMGWGKTPGQTVGVLGLATFLPEHHYNEETTSPCSYEPGNLDIYRNSIQHGLARGYKNMMYSMPLQIDDSNAEWDWFLPEWTKVPDRTHRIIKDGRTITNTLTCNSMANDLICYKINRLFAETVPELYGIYYDIADVSYCANTLHGHGGRDAFGKPYYSSIALSMREGLLRVYRLHKKYGKNMLIHAHSFFNPIAHTFADLWFPGEQYAHGIPNNPDWFYNEEIPLSVFQSELNAEIKGMAVIFLPELARSCEFNLAIANRRQDYLNNPEWTLRLLTPMLLHDLPVASDSIHYGTLGRWWILKNKIELDKMFFHGYWQKGQPRSDSDGVLVSCYEGNSTPYDRVVIIGNMTRNTLPAGVVLNDQSLKISAANLRLFDLWNETQINATSLSQTPVPGGHFLVIGVKIDK